MSALMHKLYQGTAHDSLHLSVNSDSGKISHSFSPSFLKCLKTAKYVAISKAKETEVWLHYHS